MEPSYGWLEIPQVKLDVETALSGERRDGALRGLLKLDHLTTGDTYVVKANLRYEGMLAAVELVPKRLEKVQAIAGDSAVPELVSAILRRIAGYWRHQHDLIPDELGVVGRLDDALVVHSLLDKVSRHHVGLSADAQVSSAVDELRLGLSSPAKDAVSLMVDRLWNGEFTPTSLVSLEDPVRAVQPAPGAPRFVVAPGALREPTSPPTEPVRPEAQASDQDPEHDPKAPRLFEIWFGTNRAPVDGADLTKGFRGKIDPAGEVRYGVCDVEVPESHKFGSVGTKWYHRWRRLEFRDDSIKVRGRRPLADRDGFLADLRDTLEATDGKQVLFYLHGYNVSFDSAAVRAAQLFADLKVDGAAAFFSWPSNAAPAMYAADAARVEDSEQQIAQFLTSLVADLGDATVHVIAHSMGNRGLARAVQRITTTAAEDAGVRFGQIILAAPDVSVPLFKELAKVYPRISERTTMYVSAADRALGLSQWLQDGPRAGFTPPITVVDDIDTIEVTDIDVSALGHGYYAAAEAVLYDIAELLRHNAPPARRTRLQACSAEGSAYWSIGR